MNSYYLYVEAGPQVDAASKFFKVSIGKGLIGSHAKNVIESYAASHGHFFNKWCAEIDEFCAKLAKSIEAHTLPIIWLSSKEMVRYLKTHELPGEASVMTSAAIRQKKMLCVDFRISSSINFLKSSHR